MRQGNCRPKQARKLASPWQRTKTKTRSGRSGSPHTIIVITKIVITKIVIRQSWGNGFAVFVGLRTHTSTTSNNIAVKRAKSRLGKNGQVKPYEGKKPRQTGPERPKPWSNPRPGNEPKPGPFPGLGMSRKQTRKDLKKALPIWWGFFVNKC